MLAAAHGPSANASPGPRLIDPLLGREWLRLPWVHARLCRTGGQLVHVTGGCHCGAIRFEAEIDPTRVAACHCTDCQTMGSSAFRVLTPVSEPNFRVVAGEPTVYVKTADSGRRRAQGFCGKCGTHLYATAPAAESAADQPRAFTVRVGAIDQRRDLSPRFEMWCDSRLPWLPPLAGTRLVRRQ